jgi:glycosyltransferase involved in cell wall biosynthesis
MVGMFLDPAGRSPDVLLDGGWREFGRTAVAAHRADVAITIVQAAWADAEREIDGVRCSFIRGAGRLRARLRSLEPQVIHYEGLVQPGSVRRLAAAFPNVPIMAQDHATRCPRGWRRWWYRWGFAPLAGVAFTARAQAQPFLHARVLRPTIPIFEVVEVSTAFTDGDQAAARTAAALDGDPCLVWVGNLDDNKDPLMVLDAVSAAARALPGLKLHMYFRQAPLRTAVERRMAADDILRDRVRLRGAVRLDQMEAVYRGADFLVQASHEEGSGVALIEALASGSTPLVTDIPSFRRITGNGLAGALVPVGDSGALARALIEWSRRDRANLRRNARAHFERDLSFDALGAQLRAAYAVLCQS